jgi:hypothetical protein
MIRFVGRAATTAAVAIAMALVTQGTANAAPSKAHLDLEGSGTIAPGLTLTGAMQSLTLEGTGTGYAIAGLGVADGLFYCSFSGNSSVPETQLTGQGNLSGSCNGATIGTAIITCSVAYVRTGAHFTLTLACEITASGPPGANSGTATGAGTCDFAPTSAPGAPVTNWDNECVFDLSGTA